MNFAHRLEVGSEQEFHMKVASHVRGTRTLIEPLLGVLLGPPRRWAAFI